MSYLSGRFHLSKRSVHELVEAAFEIPISLGTVAALAQQTSVALIPAHEQARNVHRGAPGLKALLGEAIAGIVISDRWWGYNGLPLEQRQVYWAHLKRDFQKCLERGGPGKAVGEVGLMVVEDVFTLWWQYREGLIDRPTLGTQLEPVIEELRLALERGEVRPAPIPRSWHFATTC